MDIEEAILRIERERREQNSIYHSIAAKFGLTDTALWVLYCVSEPGESPTQQELCRRGFCAKQTVNTAISGLARGGFVELIPLPGTRNRKTIHLTPKGRELADKTVRPLKKAEENAYGRLSEPEMRAYIETAGRLNAYLREEAARL